MKSIELAEKIIRILDAKKADDIVTLDIGGQTSLADYFVIASGKNTTLVKTLAEEIEEKLSGIGIEPRRIEGASSCMWILMDYSDVIVHVFYSETRDFYCLERLWADASRVDVQKLLQDGSQK